MKTVIEVPNLEFFKELGRIAILAAVSGLITYLAPIEDKTVTMMILTAILRATDKHLHQNALAGEAKGLVRF